MDELDRQRLRMRSRQAALRRLGVSNTRCLCGETDPHCFEVEHRERRTNSDAVWGICKNCHAKITAHQMTEHPVITHGKTDPLEKAGHALLGMAEYNEITVNRQREIAALLFMLVEAGVTSGKG